MSSTDQDSSLLTFIQYDIPPLKSGQYTISVTQTVAITNQTIEPNTFTASKTFAVPGNRFQLNGDDVVSVFPAPLSNGEYDGVMPMVVLQRHTLPWQRTSVFDDESAPWLAVLLFEADDVPALQSTTAAAIFPSGDEIKVAGSTTTGTGTMPTGTVSYDGMNPLDYGQSPADPCTVIDLPIDLFSRVCPSAADLPLLAHIRRTDTYDATDSDVVEQDYAIVLGNRWPKINADAYAFLVSLENMGDFLPNDDGSPSSNWPADAKTVRLICLRTWRFFTNDLDQKFQSLCENLNRDASGTLGLTTLRLPSVTPDKAAVDIALTNQASGALTDADSDTLVQTALSMGYTALNHRLREAGTTVSWYRGPLVPYQLEYFDYTLASCPDALLRYDPQTGMFDVTYAQAWQLGQLLALQNTSFSVSLYTWKQSLKKSAAAQAEMAVINQQMGSRSLQSFFPQRLTATANDGASDVPSDIAEWLGALMLLKGVPFAALVADASMLPVESLRFFHLDPDWVAALVDGACSIGRTGSSGAATDTELVAQASTAAQARARRKRKNQRPQLATQQTAAGDNDFEVITGCLLRSQLVSGWPALNVNGYGDIVGTAELPKLRMERLSNEILICLFEGEVQSLTISEAPEQLHCGVEDNADKGYTTTLRDITGDTPGQQYVDDNGVPVSVAVVVRDDEQTLQVSATAKAIQAKLNADYNQDLTTFTSAEFALELVKGVVKIEYKLQ